MFFSPVLENKFEIGTYPGSLFLQLLNIVELIEEKLNGIIRHHKVKNKIFVFLLVAGNTNHITNLLTILSYQLIPDIPVRLSYHVGKEYCLNLVQQEYFCYRFQHFVDRIPKCYVATASY